MPDYLRVEESEFLYGDDDERTLIAMCTGECERNMRPLACRIFPLAPILRDGKLEIVQEENGNKYLKITIVSTSSKATHITEPVCP